MKAFNILFTLLIVSVAGNAQDTLKANLFLVKESPKIDSLISSIVEYAPNTDALKKDSCIFLYLFNSKIDVGYISNLNMFGNKEYITIIPQFLTSKNKGYFKFRGYLIFICTDDQMKRFYTYTQTNKQFTFYESQDIIFKYQMYWTVFYNHGFFNWGEH